MDPEAKLLPSLDNIDADAQYYMSGKTLIEIRDAIRSLRLKLDDPDNNPLNIVEVGPDGTLLGMDTVECST